MTIPPEPPSEDRPDESVENLGRSYGDLLDHQPWESDIPDEAVDSPPTGRAPPVSPTPPTPLRIIEAMLFVGGPPLTAARAEEVIRGLTTVQFTQAVDALNQEYRSQGRPYLIQAQEQGY